jgi:hypothetical protein
MARSPDDLTVRKWLEEHYGAFSEIAVAFAVNPRFVQQIAYGADKAPRSHLRIEIERELRARGWPGHKRTRT